ncbi:hypothetical protein QR680_006368 [Steinernema hermaphroditum]|uniref:Uncharacterized protein n=1 Tax=Steinernema hermaphroditum TaxID=289476 RepID=A0AA39HVB5_9BILA|nr:hypothetical protein QR680_006368 [Steinernema hermaphroditum]
MQARETEMFRLNDFDYSTLPFAAERRGRSYWRRDVSSESRTSLLSFSELKEQDSTIDFDDSRIFCDDADGFIDGTIEEQAQYFSYNWKRRSGRIALDARIAGETSTGQRSVPRTKTSTVKKTPSRLDLDIIYEDTPIRDGADLPNDDAAFPTCSTAKKGSTKMDLDFLKPVNATLYVVFLQTLEFTDTGSHRHTEEQLDLPNSRPEDALHHLPPLIICVYCFS